MPGELRSIVLNLFRPGMAVELPKSFAGRKDAISELTDALRIRGSCPIIFGERGLGKTSLANQIERIALGDVELLRRFGLDGLGDDERFVTFYVACTDDVNSKDALIQRLINSAQGYRDAQELPKDALAETTTTRKIKLKVYESTVASKYKTEDRLQEFVSLSVEEKLEATLGQVISDEGKSVLVIVDEIDRVKSLDGLASFLKGISSEDVKFMLVGVAHSLSSLIADHSSIERSVFPVQVKPMGGVELQKIIRLAERTATVFGIKLRFEPAARKLIVTSAGGFPWFVHVLGQSAAVATYDDGEQVVTVGRVETTLSNLAESRYARPFGDRYLVAVGDSRPREIVMRLFARWTERDIPTSELYPLAHSLGVAQPSSYVKELQRKKNGLVLARAPFKQSGGVYAFTNAMFKRYVNLRGSVYGQVFEEVNAVCAAHGFPDSNT